MILIIFATLLILGIAFFQTIQGCFSAIIMAILTVLCAAIALNFYEPLGALLAGHLGAIADPAAMSALFIIILLVFRIIFDRLIRGNVVMGLWPDHIVGSVFGLITATIITGMFMIILQMLPMPASILYWRPYDSALEVKDGGPPRWAAYFTLATAGRLSDGALSPITSGKNLRISHDDLPLESFCLRNRPTGARVSAPADALKIISFHVVELPDEDSRLQISTAEKLNIQEIQDATPSYPLLFRQERDDTKVLAIRVSISQSARNEDDNWWRLPATHFRLVCKSGRSFYPVGYLTYTANWQVNTSVSDKEITQIGDILVARQWHSKGGPENLFVDWLYRIPTGEKASYLVFRRTAKDDLPLVSTGLPTNQMALSVKPVFGRVKLEPTGRGMRLFIPDLIEVNRYLPEGLWLHYRDESPPNAVKQIELKGGELQKVLVIGDISEFAATNSRSARHVTRFHQPSNDTVLMQVRCKVNREFRGESVIGSLKPALLLNTGEKIGHSGAFLFYDSDGSKQVHFYYDSAASMNRLDADFIQTFSNKSSVAGTFGLIFSVPASQNGNVVGMTFGAGVGPVYNFNATMPLACTERRR
ncbi:MAG: CvpA family protein [Planctomycetota bacterium]|nr:CvpA family protein [Planctomycetota bacterium]